MGVVEQTKGLLAEERLKIELFDFVGQKVQELLLSTTESQFPIQKPWSAADFSDRLRRYEEVVKDVLYVQALLGFWGEKCHHPALTLPTRRVGDQLTSLSGTSGWLAMRFYPLFLLFYAGGIAAVAAGRYDNLRVLMRTPIRVPLVAGRGQAPTVEDFWLLKLVTRETGLQQAFAELPGQQTYTPQSEHVLNFMQPLLEELFRLGSDYEASFDRFEALCALEHTHLSMSAINLGNWVPMRIGRFGWKWTQGDGPMKELIEEANREGCLWEPVKAGLFDGSVERFIEATTAYSKFLSKRQLY